MSLTKQCGQLYLRGSMVSNQPLSNEQRLIVADEEFIRQALKDGKGPEYLLGYYAALGDQRRTTFVAALLCIVQLAHLKEGGSL